MKKISLVVLALFTSLAMFAQNENRTEMKSAVRFGVKAGVNLSKLRPNDVPSGADISTNLKTSFGGGFLVNIPFGTNLAFQPEVLFNGQGSKINVKQTVITTTTDKYEQDLRYLSVPLMLQWKSTGGFYAEVGPQLSFLLDARYDGQTEYENEKAFENFEVSAGAGLGYMTRVGVGIGARYNHGFSNVLDNENSSDISMKHSVIHVGLFYHFGANK
jgi:hypothetical protein